MFKRILESIAVFLGKKVDLKVEVIPELTDETELYNRVEFNAIKFLIDQGYSKFWIANNTSASQATVYRWFKEKPELKELWLHQHGDK